MGLKDEPWRWAPILLLSPLPWAYISLFVIIWGQPVLRGAETRCVDPSSNAVDTSALTVGLAFAVVIAYLFLATYVWVFLGHNVYAWLPSRADKRWSLRRTRVLRPFTSLLSVALLYGFLMVLAFVATAMLSAGVAGAGALCSSQTPLLLSFSTILLIMGWVALSVTAARLFTVVFGARIGEKLKEKGLAGGDGADGGGAPQSDVDKLKDIFKKFDKSGEGNLDAAELAPFLEALGMDVDEDEVPDILAEIDRDGQGTVSLREFEVWYMKDKATREGGEDGGS